MKKNISTAELGDLISRVPSIKTVSKAKKDRKPCKSTKPLKFDISAEDAPMKRVIIQKINNANLTYGDLYDYLIKINDGDIPLGQRNATNIINALKNGHDMMTNTCSKLCDFLNLEIALIPKDVFESDKKDDENGN